MVNKKNRGIRWALVWLTGVDDIPCIKPIPTHKSLQKMPKSVEISQSCCVFEPRVLGLVEGQTLVVKNSSNIPHNANLNGGPGGPHLNRLLPAGGSMSCPNIKVRPLTIPLMCSCACIHPWMKCYIRVFNHPYFAVTDADGKFTIKNAPAGRYRLMIWHEQGYVIINPKNLKDRGKVIHILGNDTTDAGKISFVPHED